MLSVILLQLCKLNWTNNSHKRFKVVPMNKKRICVAKRGLLLVIPSRDATLAFKSCCFRVPFSYKIIQKLMMCFAVHRNGKSVCRTARGQYIIRLSRIANLVFKSCSLFFVSVIADISSRK